MVNKKTVLFHSEKKVAPEQLRTSHVAASNKFKEQLESNTPVCAVCTRRSNQLIAPPTNLT